MASVGHIPPGAERISTFATGALAVGSGPMMTGYFVMHPTPAMITFIQKPANLSPTGFVVLYCCVGSLSKQAFTSASLSAMSGQIPTRTAGIQIRNPTIEVSITQVTTRT